jgi:PAS domain-containing protein
MIFPQKKPSPAGCTTMDITERKQCEEVLRKQKAHFEKLFDLAPEAIVLRISRTAY